MGEEFQFESDPEGTRRYKGADEKFCESCGEAIKIKAAICPNCGVPQRGKVSKPVLMLLTFFMGGIGVHKFYIRKYLQGVLYLLFFWTGIPGFIAFIEFIIYACTSSEKLQEKYKGSGSAAVIVIVVFGFVFVTGILAAIAIPNFVSYRQKDYDGTARAALMKAVTVQELFYNDYKKYANSIDTLREADYGLRINKGVNLTIEFADRERYMMTASHEKGKEIFKIQGPGGDITKESKADDRGQ